VIVYIEKILLAGWFIINEFDSQGVFGFMEKKVKEIFFTKIDG
jgi:hypothetical protein